MSQQPYKISVKVDGEIYLVEVEDLNQRPVIVYVEGSRYEIEVDQAAQADDQPTHSPRLAPLVHSIPAGTACDVTAPMPGDIVSIFVKAGQVVEPGDPLCVLDAMKMKNTIHAPQSGTIREICVTEGDAVEFGVILFKFG